MNATYPMIIQSAYSSETKRRSIVDELSGAFCRVIGRKGDDVEIETSIGRVYWVHIDRLVHA